MYYVINRSTGLCQSGPFPTLSDAQQHKSRILAQWAGADDEHPRPDYVVAEVLND